VQSSSSIAIGPEKPVQPLNGTLKGTWMKAQVVSFTAAAITVQEPQDPRKIHTFSFSPELREKMARLMERGGYQSGDRIKIQYNSQSSVATDIRGKPSKSP
jgi:hypothetical protein